MNRWQFVLFHNHGELFRLLLRFDILVWPSHSRFEFTNTTRFFPTEFVVASLIVVLDKHYHSIGCCDLPRA